MKEKNLEKWQFLNKNRKKLKKRRKLRKIRQINRNLNLQLPIRKSKKPTLVIQSTNYCLIFKKLNREELNPPIVTETQEKLAKPSIKGQSTVETNET